MKNRSEVKICLYTTLFFFSGEIPAEDSSPVTQVLEAIPPELYVTNHKKWLSLRVGGGGGGGGGGMGLPFCC